MIDHDELLATTRTLAVWVILLLWGVGFACGWLLHSLM
jgi:hypothetical protein